MNKPADFLGIAKPPTRGAVTAIEPSSQIVGPSRVQLGLKIGAVIGAATAAAAVIAWNLVFSGMPTLPRPDDLWTLNREPAVQFVDARGEMLAVRGNLYGPIVRSAELPPYIAQAFIAAEDQRFMEHGGIDLQSIMRAVAANIAAGKTVQGGSTLTQQLVKNLLVGNEQTVRRKVQEARLAIEMDSKLSKQEILDLYINRVYLGANAYGVEAAAHAYFDKPAVKLTLAEAAFLGALPKAPSRYAADRTGAKTIARVHYVLDRMVASGFVTLAASADAKAHTFSFVGNESKRPISGYVLDEAMKEARAILPDFPPDAVITLTVDGNLQRRAEQALATTLNDSGLGASEGAIVVMDRTGDIRALVGGKDYARSQFNRATQAKRQPGSAFKIFVYAAAIEQGLGPTTVRDDAPIKIGNWEPANYNDEYAGPITLAKAMAVSSNSVAARIGSEVGPRRIADLARRFGIKSPLQAYPSIALGGDEVTLLEMTSAYAVLANQGWRVDARLVSEIRDQRGKVLYASPAPDRTQVYDKDSAETLTGMLSNVVQSGTGTQARVSGWPIAGKTGTSQSWRDAWFVGYSAQMIGGVWIGNDDDSGTKKVTGGGAAAALFAKVMTAAHHDLKPEPMPGTEIAASWLDTPFDERVVLAVTPPDGATEQPVSNLAEEWTQTVTPATPPPASADAPPRTLPKAPPVATPDV